MLDQNKKTRTTKRRRQTTAGKARGGKLMPLGAVKFGPNETGVSRQSVMIELEPIASKLITNISARLTAVMVPALAIDEMQNSANQYPGNEAIFRDRLLAGDDVFPLEAPNTISDRMGIEPIMVNGSPYVSSAVRVAHNIAVNYLRRRAYIDAELVAANNTSITPAIISHSVLERYNGVLDPEDRVNGSVNLEGEVPIRGIGLRSGTVGTSDTNNNASVQSDGTVGQGTDPAWKVVIAANNDAGMAELIIEEDPDNTGYPNIRADFALGTGQNLNLQQFYEAERVHERTKLMRYLVDKYPEHGEDIVVAFAHGMNIETGKMPYKVFEKTVYLNKGMKSAMDGDNLDLRHTSVHGDISFSVPILANEFGGVLVTFLEVKPDEVVANQPHPDFGSTWGVYNFEADRLALDPVPVTLRELDSEVDQGDEGTIAFWVGNHHMERNYDRHDFHRGVDPTTVAHKNAMWQLAIPLSVNPQNILYPDDIDHYPFQLNAPTDDAVSYTHVNNTLISSPMILGPTPQEELAIIETEDIFEDDDS